MMVSLQAMKIGSVASNKLVNNWGRVRIGIGRNK